MCWSWRSSGTVAFTRVWTAHLSPRCLCRLWLVQIWVISCPQALGASQISPFSTSIATAHQRKAIICCFMGSHFDSPCTPARTRLFSLYVSRCIWSETLPRITSPREYKEYQAFSPVLFDFYDHSLISIFHKEEEKTNSRSHRYLAAVTHCSFIVSSRFRRFVICYADERWPWWCVVHYGLYFGFLCPLPPPHAAFLRQRQMFWFSFRMFIFGLWVLPCCLPSGW